MPQMAESRKLATSAFFSASRSLNPVYFTHVTSRWVIGVILFVYDEVSTQLCTLLTSRWVVVISVILLVVMCQHSTV